MERKIKNILLRITTSPIIEPVKRKLINISFYIQRFNRFVFYSKYKELFHNNGHKHHKKHHKKHKRKD